MKIAQFLAKRKKTQRWLADKLTEAGMPVGRTAVDNWVQGIRFPRRRFALKIVEITGGAVTLKDIYA